ncbi:MULTISPECIES: AraC family transcriptional regulator [unclassified Achromobacter]|uniref:helix-turn-helix transcriptional regulator n=1 Tax=unclassified Achromobacter TaxID=2626865 RepID=UPI000B516878|nr:MULTISPECIES: AraC family transcriptional regulator [unclassified Achromobacter]OWT80296.1 AraC family transcriptional regulator [Achromobacter sp. HZ34]OWT82179.1 AraC family transcriptional regulator [Achromobacter sp. HZ28]
MNLPVSPSRLSLAVRSYGEAAHAHSHDFQQLVLPLHGSMEIEVGGRGARLAQGCAAFVRQDMPHAQCSRVENRFLVVDIPTGTLAAEATDRLSSRRFLTLSPAAGHLVDFMALSLNDGAADVRSDAWLSLLLQSLGDDTDETGESAGRMERLLRAVRTRLGRSWTVAEMAAMAGVSASRLHVLFRQAYGTTPRAWLADQRLQEARHRLGTGTMSIAEIAGRAGYSDQTALTRAFRLATGNTPAEYRRLQRELLSRKQ